MGLSKSFELLLNNVHNWNVTFDVWNWSCDTLPATPAANAQFCQGSGCKSDAEPCSECSLGKSIALQGVSKTCMLEGVPKNMHG